MAILVVDFLISEPSLREKKKTQTHSSHPSQLPTYAPNKNTKQKKTHPAETNNEKTSKKQQNSKNPRNLPRQEVSPPFRAPNPDGESAYPKRWNESPQESVDLRLEARWCSPTTQGSPLLSAPWCQCLDLNHPGHKWNGWQNVHILNQSCVYTDYMR